MPSSMDICLQLNLEPQKHRNVESFNPIQSNPHPSSELWEQNRGEEGEGRG